MIHTYSYHIYATVTVELIYVTVTFVMLLFHAVW